MPAKNEDTLGSSPAPQTHALPATALVPVPIHRALYEHERPQQTLGYLDRPADSSRPFLLPAPALRSADHEVRRAWGPVAAHASHLLTSSGFLQYGVELSTAWAIGGDGLQPNISPRVESLGWTPEFAAKWSKTVEQAFADWSHDRRACDGLGQQKWGALQGAAYKGWFRTGDIFAALDYGPKRGTAWRTSINLIDGARVATPPAWQRGGAVTQGFEFDDRGRKLAVHLRPLLGFGDTVRLPMENSSGKALVLHVFDPEVGTIRGISPLGAAIQGVLQAQQVADAAILASHVAAMLVGVVTSDLPSPELMNQLRSITDVQADPYAASMQARAGWHEGLKEQNAHISLGANARIAHLMSGERFELHAGKQGFDDYETILRMGLAEAARAIGLAPEFLHGLKDKATYSSLKVAAVEGKAIIDRRRKILLEPLNEFALHAVTEELVAMGEVDFPAPGKGFSRGTPLERFRTYGHLALRSEWSGPAIADPDPLKEAKAAAMRIQFGLTSHTDEISAMGRDRDAVLDKRASDRQALRDRGLFLPWPDEPGSSTRPQSNGGSK